MMPKPSILFLMRRVTFSSAMLKTEDPQEVLDHRNIDPAECVGVPLEHSCSQGSAFSHTAPAMALNVPLSSFAHSIRTADASVNMLPGICSTSGRVMAPDHSHAFQRNGRKMYCQASKSETLSYRTAGVDIDAGNELVRRIQKMNPNIGGFSGMVPFGMALLSL